MRSCGRKDLPTFYRALTDGGARAADHALTRSTRFRFAAMLPMTNEINAHAALRRVKP
jgi:hypothetical protein